MKFTKGLIIGIILTVLAIYFYNKKNGNKIALPKFPEINSNNSNVIKLEPKKDTEQKNEIKKYPEKTFIKFNQKSEDLKEFEKNVNEIAGADFFVETGIADSYFFRVLADFKKGTKDIFDNNQISEDFIKDFNIFYNRLKNRKYFKTNEPKEKIVGIKKGDKAKEVNMLKNIINNLSGYSKNVVNSYEDEDNSLLYEDGNYNKKLYQIAKDLFTGTSVYNSENEGEISNNFIRNIYNFINNLKY